MRALSVDKTMALDSLEEQIHDIEVRRQDLVEYRRCIVRHKPEDNYANVLIENLQDDTALVTSDNKMKLLSCFFWVNL